MKKIIGDRHGAVTIIVSLMLIPAILLSGTAVDLARIHAAKSMAQNANLLITNAALTRYDALLKDLYGLFGVAHADPVLGGMVNEYVRAAIYGDASEEDDSWIETGLGTFQSFHGSDVSAEIIAADGFNLESADVLKRQIEEYMKFRGPIIIVEQILEAITEDGKEIKASNAARQQSDAVNKKLQEILVLFRELYDAINEADKCRNPETVTQIMNVSRQLNDIREAFGALGSRYAEWQEACMRIVEIEGTENAPGEIEEAADPLDQEHLLNELEVLKGFDGIDGVADSGGMAKDLERRYRQELLHIQALVSGGSGWEALGTPGRKVDMRPENGGPAIKFSDGTPKEVWKDATYRQGSDLTGLAPIIEDAKRKLQEFKDKFSAVTSKAQSIDAKREELMKRSEIESEKGELQKLEESIANEDCSNEVRETLQSQIDECKSMFDEFGSATFEQIATPYKAMGDNYIDGDVIGLLNNIRYRENIVPENPDESLTLDQLTGISTGNFALPDDVYDGEGNIDYEAKIDPPGAALHPVKVFSDFDDVGYSTPTGFDVFRTTTDEGYSGISPSYGAERERLYGMLDQLANGSGDGYDGPREIAGYEGNGDGDPEKHHRSILEQLMHAAEDIYNDGLINNPKGAERIEDSSVADGEQGGLNAISSMLDFFEDPIGEIQDLADFALLITYDMGMFSNYTTGKPESFANGVAADVPKSITNATIGPNVNYFYQSEWEYLYAGKKEADKNLGAVADLIRDIRRICNAIAVFGISEITGLADQVKLACSGIPFIGVALGWVLYFATLLAFEECETLYDMTRLRGGHKVPLLKNEDSWQFTPSKFHEVLEQLSEGREGEVKEAHESESGISYEQYLLVFFLISDNPDLAQRTGNLIEWNVINYKEGINSGNIDEETGHVTDGAISAMSAALAEEDCFRLKDMCTDFNATTKIDLRLMFLAMPLFWRQGAAFSEKYPISATHYGGY